MASIGDLILRIVADLKGFTTSVVKEGGKAGEKAGTAASKGFRAKFAGAKGGLLAGLGLGAGLGVVGLATKAVGGLVDAFGAAKDAAIADEQSQTKLGAVLRANIPEWNGNTKEIEKTLAARVKLGFADDEQRESLAGLVAATHDQTEALDLQRTAMDLARFSGIDLASASQALVTIEAGQFRALKKLGIQIKKGATAQEAQIEVQKVVNGQAEAYADTVGGKLLANQLKYDEAMENFGYKTLPLVTEALNVVTYALDRSSVPLETLIKAAGNGPGGAAGQLGELKKAADELGLTLEATWKIAADASVTGAADIVAAGRIFQDDLAKSERTSKTVTGGIATNFDDMAQDVKHDMRSTAQVVKDNVDAMIGYGQQLLDEFFDPIETREDIRQSRLDLHAAEEAARNAKTKGEYRDAAADIASSLRTQGDALFDLAEQGKLTEKDVRAYNKDITAAYKALGKAVPPELQKIVDELAAIASYKGVAINVKVQKTVQKGGKVGLASGGIIRKNEPRLVGEYRPEVFVPEVAGRIIPRVDSMAPGGMGGYVDNSTVNLTALPVKTDMMSVVHEMQRISDGKRLRRQGG